MSKLTFLHNHTSSSRFAIRGGATGKSCEGWMRPIPMGTHVASASRHVLPYVVVPQESPVRDGCDLFQWEPTSRLCLATFFHTWMFRITKMRGKDALHSNGEYMRLDAVHAAALCMDVVSLVNGNVCGRFRECWHERF
jgi:hypothetical protein